jgi:hypothetical protein
LTIRVHLNSWGIQAENVVLPACILELVVSGHRLYLEKISLISRQLSLDRLLPSLTELSFPWNTKCRHSMARWFCIDCFPNGIGITQLKKFLPPLPFCLSNCFKPLRPGCFVSLHYSGECRTIFCILYLTQRSTSAWQKGSISFSRIPRLEIL